MQILILCMPTFYYQPSFFGLFVFYDWIGNAQTSLHMNHKFWNFTVSSEGSAILHLSSIITAISAWFPKRKKKGSVVMALMNKPCILLRNCSQYAIYVCRVLN